MNTVMVTLTKAEVPHYLVCSDFHNSLSADDQEEFSIPLDKMKPTVNIGSTVELKYLLETFKFWGLPGLLPEILDVLIFK